MGWPLIEIMNLISFSSQLLLPDKINSLEKLQEIPNRVDLLDKVLLDSAMETFSTDLRVCFEQIGVIYKHVHNWHYGTVHRKHHSNFVCS